MLNEAAGQGALSVRLSLWLAGWLKRNPLSLSLLLAQSMFCLHVQVGELGIRYR